KIKKIKDSDFSEEEKETLIKEQIAKTAKVISEIAGKPNLFLRFYYLIIEILTNIRILKPKSLEEHLSKNEEAKEVLVKKIGDAYKKDDVDRTVLGEVAKKPDDMIKFGQSGAQAADFAPGK
ncbi:MAG: hypothetical protein LBJ09_00900, partial [Clostridiales bacterium]|nr:hypothetical protein [Clostridiales bacterium]